MADTVLFGDVEAAVIDYLNSVLTPPVSDRVPVVTTAMLPFIVVERLGGPIVSVVTEQATVTVESWANGWKTANDNARLARKSVHDLAGLQINGLNFYKVTEFAGPARIVDPISSKPRVVFTVSLTVRGLQS